MGTNFYWKDPSRVYGTAIRYEDATDPRIHIGKRSASGRYCFDCGVTLMYNTNDVESSPYVGRNALIHTGEAGQREFCPQCGKGKIDEKIEESAAGLELGFRKSPYTIEERQGVRSCSSFSWAQDPGWTLSKLLAMQHEVEVAIVDEYDRAYTAREFLANVLASCPIWFTNSVGIRFS